MVSIRRRKLLGLCSGRNSFLSPHLILTEKEKISHNVACCTLPGNIVHPLPLVDGDQPKEDNNSKAHTGLTNASGSSTSKEQQNQKYPEVKRRKRHQRKQVENQEPCLMRGVYFKNMKWQAAIKVDKKQIHLGTVASQEEAARLYDRAAFMCGRESNFELSEEEKQELNKFKWDEFLAKTRAAIRSKRPRRRIEAGAPVNPSISMQYTDSECDPGVDEPDTSTS